MANRLRVARHSITAYSLPVGVDRPDVELHRQLQSLIRRRLSPITATLFAEPVRSSDGQYLEWYTELAGQPTPLAALPEAERERGQGLLNDRLTALRELARRLSQVEPALAPALLQATTYPGDETIYVVGGQPVLTFWGYGTIPPEPVSAASTSAKLPMATASAPVKSRRWLWLSLSLLAVAVWAAFHLSDWRWPPWGPDYAALLSAEKDKEEALRQQLSELGSRVAQALGPCALQSRLDGLHREEALESEKLKALEGALAERVTECHYRGGLEAVRAEEQALNATLGGLYKRLAEKLQKCSQKSVTKPKDSMPKKPPAGDTQPKEATPDKTLPAKNDKLSSCPGQRRPEDAPDVAIVLDASGSMRLPEVMTPAQKQQYKGCMQRSGPPSTIFDIIQQVTRQLACAASFEHSAGPTRLQAAQRSMSNIVPSLPEDVDIGLAVLEDCPRATDYGFYGASQRRQLLQQVDRLTPRRGTPLANGLELAGQKVDGVRAPGVIVVVSDGEDSCRQDPCLVARQLKARKPQLRINVVDIVGEGYADCLAKLTRGRVLTSTSGMPMDQMIREAARDAQKPAHCK